MSLVDIDPSQLIANMSTIDCVVFTTDLRTGPDAWQAWGALEVGTTLGKPLHASTMTPVIFFRSPKGHIQNITKDVSKEIRGDHLALVRKFGAEPAGSIGFDIVFTGEDGEDVTFDGYVEREINGEPMKQLWRGTFVCEKKESLSTIINGPQAMPTRVQNFLSIEPWEFVGDNKEQHQDAVAQLSSTVMKNLIMQAMPSEAVALFYNGKIESPDTQLREIMQRLDSYHESIKSYLHPQYIFGDHQDLFRYTAINIMVRDVRSKDWLNDMQKGRCNDKADKFFAILNSKDDKIQEAAQDYQDLHANAEDLVHRYRDALRRCYLASYMQLRRPAWDDAATDPASLYTAARDYLGSDQYLVHWLPTLVDTPENKFAVPLKDRLEVMGDKLSFLANLAGLKTSNDPNKTPSSEVNDLMSKLAAAANQSGLLRGTMVEGFKSENMNAKMVSSPYEKFPDVLHFFVATFDGRAADIMEQYATPYGLYVPILPDVPGPVDWLRGLGRP